MSVAPAVRRRVMGRAVNLRRDHIAGGAFIVASALLLALSGDLPFGTLASPGAGMMPKLMIALMAACGFALLARAADGPPLSKITWDDLSHAARLTGMTGAAIAFYETAGFVITMAALMFGLIFIVERKPLLPAAAFSVGVTVLAYTLFGTLLKSPLPRGIIGY